MSRTFEVVEAQNAKSRLTVTPTRVTLKIHPNHEEKRERLIAAAHAIADQTDYPQSLRGFFNFEKGMIQMRNGKIKFREGYKKNKDIFCYSIDGKFISKILNKKTAEEVNEDV